MPFVNPATANKPNTSIIENASNGTKIEGTRVPSYYLKERAHFRTVNNRTVIPVPTDIASLYSWYETDGVVFASVNGLSEAAVGQGYHTTITEEEPEKAKELVDEFGKELNLDTFLSNVCKNMLIAGFCPVETRVNKFPSKSSLKIIHPTTVKKIIVNKQGIITELIQTNPDQGKKGHSYQRHKPNYVHPQPDSKRRNRNKHHLTNRNPPNN